MHGQLILFSCKKSVCTGVEMACNDICWIYCRNDACVEGGESVLLDAFAVVEEMRKKHPQHFATLTRVPTTFQRIHSKRLVTQTCTDT